MLYPRLVRPKKLAPIVICPATVFSGKLKPELPFLLRDWWLAHCNPNIKSFPVKSSFNSVWSTIPIAKLFSQFLICHPARLLGTANKVD
jgi:hypothetical protein